MTEEDGGERTGVAASVHPLIEERKEAIRALAHDYGVARLEVFGSICTPEWDPARSDVDFLVEYPPDYEFGPWIARLFDLETDLGTLLGREVNLVMTSALRNPYFRREAAKTRLVIYDATKVSQVP